MLYKDTRLPFTAYTLTNSYVVSTSNPSIDISDIDQVVLDVVYTTGSGETNNTIEIKVEFANPVTGNPVTADWVQATSESTSSGVTTVTQQYYTLTGASAATAYAFQVALPVSSKFMRISLKESGVAANAGTATVKATLRSEVQGE